MIAILMMSAKLATPGLLKIKVFWKKDYEVIISVYDVTKKILLPDSNNIIDVRILPEKPIFLRCALRLSSIIWDWN